MTVEFQPWPKIPRHAGTNVVISEKMDGTNACIVVEGGRVVGCQSRSRIITPQEDNFGFAAWVEQNAAELAGLGDGRHFGEWVGPGIQKNPHNFDERRFYLFNSGRWQDVGPPCCHVVRVLYAGEIGPDTVASVMADLASRAKADGYKPEGVIIYYVNTRTYEKATFANPRGKWLAACEAAE